ncbi:MAG: primosomal protein N' [Actinomycetota bacterium]|nr:primosomal protein N' [Actinomycetota bacterium]
MTPPRSRTAKPAGTGTRAAAAQSAGTPSTAKKPSKTAALPSPKQPVELLPVATVAVDISLSHLDRPFDYLVPADLGETAQPGARVRVRFAGRLVDGFVLDRLERSEHGGRLGYLERVVSPEPVLTAEVLALARAVADRYVGSLADVLRLAVPPRHAGAETAVPTAPEAAGDQPPTAGQPVAGADRPADITAALPAGWSDYPAGSAFLTAVTRGTAARAVWQPTPGENWPVRLAELAAAVETTGRGVLLLVPDARDLARLDAALAQALPAERYLTLSADLGPAERYRRFLTIRRGLARIVAGTRAAAFAPVAELALTVIFDDGDELFAEPRAPYPHAREVLMMRSAAAGCALLVGGFSRTAEAQLLVESGWAKELVAARQTVRSRMPRIEAQGDSYAIGADSAASMARLTPAAFAVARAAIAADRAVLVQVPRRGYLDALACLDCRRPARCRRCNGPLGLNAGQRIPSCRWCGAPEAHFVCQACAGRELRAVGQGAKRTAEELGRAFPGAALITSAGDTIRESVPAGPAVVVATPGAEPTTEGGYGAALLLDGGVMLSRPDLRATEETLRRWMTAAALVRSAADGGRVVLGVDGSLPTAQALIRWDPGWHAALELAGRRELGFPPLVALASLTGDEDSVKGALTDLELPAGAEVLGPVVVDAPPGPGRPDEPRLRALLRIGQPGRRELAAALRAMAAERSARKGANPPRIQVDPADAL